MGGNRMTSSSVLTSGTNCTRMYRRRSPLAAHITTLPTPTASSGQSVMLAGNPAYSCSRAENSDTNATVMGRRSHTSVEEVGRQW